MRIDGGNNRVGIGTTSPAAPLDLAGNFIFKAPANTLYGNFDATTQAYAAFRLQAAGSSYGFIGQTSSLLASGGSNTALGLRSENEFAIATGGSTERLRIDASGKVGIGTTSPTAPLQLNTAGNTVDGTYYSTFTINNTGSSTWSRLRFDRSGVAKWAISLGTDDKFKIGNLFTAGSVGSPNDDTLVIDNNSNVGIGTSSPNGALHVKSATNRTINTDFTLADGTGTYTWHAYQRNGADKWRVGGKADDSYLSFYNDSNSSHQLALAANGKIFGNVAPGNFSAYASLGDFIFQQSLDDLGIGVIDSGTANTFKFINNGTEAKIAYNAALPIKFYTSDTTLQLEISNTGAIKSSSGGMVMQTKEAYNDTQTSISSGGSSHICSTTITVKANSKLAVWAHSGQILNNNLSTNANIIIQVVDSSSNVTDISDHNGNHYWWDQTHNIDRQFITGQGISGALSAGTYTVKFLAGAYGGAVTMNYQNKGAHMIIQEIAAN